MSLSRMVALLGLVLTMSVTAVAPALAHHRDGHPSAKSDAVGGQPGKGVSEHAGVQADPKRGAARAERKDVRGMALHGKIASITGTIWTIDRSGARGEVRVDVSGARVHWPGKKDATLSDFKVGHVVNVKLERSGEGRGRDRRLHANSTLHATAVHFVPTHGRGDREERTKADRFSGTVTAVSATSLTVNHQERGSRTFTLSSQTVVREGRHIASVSDIQVGERVRVTTRQGETLALEVTVRD